MEEIRERLNLLLNMIDGKTEESLIEIRKAIDEPTADNITTAIERVNSLKEKNVPYVTEIVSALEELEKKSKEVSVDTVAQESVLNSRVSLIEMGNISVAEEYKNNTDAIRKAMKTHNAKDLAAAIEQATELQNKNVSYAGEVVSSLKALMPVYVGKTYEEYLEKLEQQRIKDEERKAEKLRLEEEERKAEEEKARLEKETEERNKLLIKLNARNNEIIQNLSSVDTFNRFLDNKLKTDAINNFIKTNNEEDRLAAIEEAKAIKEKDSYTGDKLLELLANKIDVTLDVKKELDAESIENVEVTEEKLADLISKIQIENHYEKDKTDVDAMENAINEAMTTHNIKDFILAIEEAMKLDFNDIVSTLSDLMKAYTGVDYKGYQDSKKKLYDNVSLIELANNSVDAEYRNNTDAIRKAMKTRNADDFIEAIEQATELQNKNVSYASDVVSELRTLMAATIGQTYEEYKDALEQQRIREEEERQEQLRLEEAARRAEAEKQRLEQEAAKNEVIKQKVFTRNHEINNNLISLEIANSFAEPNNKYKLDSIKKFVATNSEEDRLAAIEEAKAIKERDSYTGDKLLGLLNEKLEVEYAKPNVELADEKLSSIIEDKPIIEETPVVEEKVTEEVKPVIEKQPAVEEKNTGEVKPVIEEKPVVEEKNTGEVRPVIEEKPAVEDKKEDEAKTGEDISLESNNGSEGVDDEEDTLYDESFTTFIRDYAFNGIQDEKLDKSISDEPIDDLAVVQKALSSLTAEEKEKLQLDCDGWLSNVMPEQLEKMGFEKFDANNPQLVLALLRLAPVDREVFNNLVRNLNILDEYAFLEKISLDFVFMNLNYDLAYNNVVDKSSLESVKDMIYEKLYIGAKTELDDLGYDGLLSSAIEYVRYFEKMRKEIKQDEVKEEKTNVKEAEKSDYKVLTMQSLADLYAHQHEEDKDKEDDNNTKLSEDDIAALLASKGADEEEKDNPDIGLATDDEVKTSDDIGLGSDDVPECVDDEEEITQDDIAALLASMRSEAEKGNSDIGLGEDDEVKTGEDINLGTDDVPEGVDDEEDKDNTDIGLATDDEVKTSEGIDLGSDDEPEGVDDDEEEKSEEEVKTGEDIDLGTDDVPEGVDDEEKGFDALADEDIAKFLASHNAGESVKTEDEAKTGEGVDLSSDDEPEGVDDEEEKAEEEKSNADESKAAGADDLGLATDDEIDLSVEPNVTPEEKAAIQESLSYDAVLDSIKTELDKDDILAVGIKDCLDKISDKFYNDDEELNDLINVVIANAKTLEKENPDLHILSVVNESPFMKALQEEEEDDKSDDGPDGTDDGEEEKAEEESKTGEGIDLGSDDEPEGTDDAAEGEDEEKSEEEEKSNADESKAAGADDLGLADDDDEDVKSSKKSDSEDLYESLKEERTTLALTRQADETQLETLKSDYEAKKKGLLDAIKAKSLDVELTTTVYKKTFDAYEKASQFPEEDTIIAMYDAIQSDALDPDKKQEFLDAANKLVAQYYIAENTKRSPEEQAKILANINEYIHKNYGFPPVDATSLVSVDKNKLELQTELEALNEKYDDDVNMLQEKIDACLAKEKELEQKMAEIKPDADEKSDIEEKDAEKDSLKQNVIVKTINSIKNTLGAKISSFDFKKVLAEKLEFFTKHPMATAFVGMLTVTGIIGAVSVINEINLHKEEAQNKEEIESTSENEVEEENKNESMDVEDLDKAMDEGSSVRVRI